MWLRVSATIFQLFIMLEKCVLTIQELNWNQRLGHKKTKLNICYHTLTLSTQLQNRSFHVVERTRTSSKCQKMKNARAKILFFIVKYANLWDFCCRRRRGCLSSLLLDPVRRHTKLCNTDHFRFMLEPRWLTLFRFRLKPHHTNNNNNNNNNNSNNDNSIK